MSTVNQDANLSNDTVVMGGLLNQKYPKSQFTIPPETAVDCVAAQVKNFILIIISIACTTYIHTKVLYEHITRYIHIYVW